MPYGAKAFIGPYEYFIGPYECLSSGPMKYLISSGPMNISEAPMNHFMSPDESRMHKMKRRRSDGASVRVTGHEWE
jgi:hypothetical protein